MSYLRASSKICHWSLIRHLAWRFDALYSKICNCSSHIDIKSQLYLCYLPCWFYLMTCWIQNIKPFVKCTWNVALDHLFFDKVTLLHGDLTFASNYKIMSHNDITSNWPTWHSGFCWLSIHSGPPRTPLPPPEVLTWRSPPPAVWSSCPSRISAPSGFQSPPVVWNKLYEAGIDRIWLLWNK